MLATSNASQVIESKPFTKSRSEYGILVFRLLCHAAESKFFPS
jgi:hypothetical protein